MGDLAVVTLPATLIELTRRDQATGHEWLESEHRGHLVVASEQGIVAWLGDPHAVIFPRSSVKPFQATACLGLLDDATAVNLSTRDLAICWASHSGESMHVEAVSGLLNHAGATPSDLTCPPDTPMDDPCGPKQSILHNCSGKHAMFALAGAALGVQRDTLLDPQAPLQQAVLGELSDTFGGLKAVAVDGCGAPAVAIELHALATAFIRFGTEPRYARLREGGRAHPALVSGTGRAGAAVMSTGVLAKSGAEGVYAATWMTEDGSPRAVALKIADGAPRSANAALIAVLEASGAIPPGTWTPPLPQGGGKPAGSIRPSAAMRELVDAHLRHH
ncbi:MAG: asparaginase [Nitriliruptoraceae bacterium]